MKILALRVQIKELQEYNDKHEEQATIAAATSTPSAPQISSHSNSDLQRVSRPPAQNIV